MGQLPPGLARYMAAKKAAVTTAPKTAANGTVGAGPKPTLSSGKMASVPAVRLGTHKGKHNVAHAVKTSSAAAHKMPGC